MSIKVLGISTSPRKNGNSDTLLCRALEGAESAGAQIEYIHLSDYKISPCSECNACYTTGKCRLEDDYNQILEKLLNIDRLIFATPIFFMTVCAQAKMLIDRGQCLWVRKHILKKQLFDTERDRRATVIAVGGSRGIKQFDSIRSTMKTYLDCLDMRYVSGLFVNKVDKRGDIEKHPLALNEAFRLGSALADPNTPVLEKPNDVELT
jgi:multimeric flavodoxin WrbA